MSEALRTLRAEPLRRFKPYPTYKDSGVDWLGKIPAHWKIARVGDLTKLVNGYPFDSEFFVRGEGVPLVRIRDLCSTETEVNYTGPLIDDAWIETGDVIIGMDGDFNVGRWRGPKALLNQRMCCLRPRSGTHAGFVTYLLPDPLKVINDLTYSTTVKHLSSNDVRKIRLGAPPEPEQRAIAAFLDRETARIDALVAKKERLIELLHEKRTALITRAVTKGLDPTVPMKDSGVECLEEVPAHWSVKRVKHVTSKIGSGKTPTGGAEVYVSEGVMLIRSQNVHFGGLVLDDVAYIDSVTDAQMAGSRVHDGDVLLNITGASLGRCCVARLGGKPANVNQHVCLIRPKAAAYISEFLAAALASHSGQAQIFTTENGISRDALNFAQIGELVVAQPPLEEQRAIVIRFEGYAAHIEALIAKVRDAIERLKELRAALISAAVTGKIDVREEAA